MLSYEIGRKFLKLVAKNYTVKKEDPERDTGETIQAFAELFGSRQATIADLARVADENIRFPGERA